MTSFSESFLREKFGGLKISTKPPSPATPISGLTKGLEIKKKEGKETSQSSSASHIAPISMSLPKVSQLNIPIAMKKKGNVISDGTFSFDEIKMDKNGLVGLNLSLSPSTSSSLHMTPFSPDGQLYLGENEKIPYESLVFKKNSKLGRGASACVFRVSYKSFPFALKKINLEEDTNPASVTDEIRNLYHSMQCHHIIRLIDAYYLEDENAVAILMEFMNLGSLLDIIKIINKIPEEVLSEITYQILQALIYLEENCIIHRDIKPGNILLNKQGVVKLGDFGMSKKSIDGENQQAFMGTKLYMSPERLKGEEYGFPSEIWSLGVTIAEIALGRFPFEIQNFGTFSVFQHITNNYMTELQKFSKEISKELFEFIKDCLILDPNTRPRAKDLLKYDFITKHINAKSNHFMPSSEDSNENQGETFVAIKLLKWLEIVFLPERKEYKLRKERKRKRSIIKKKNTRANGVPDIEITNLSFEDTFN